MLSPDQLSKIAVLYCSYNEVIRPLISEIEARQENFPAPLFNEIRAFNDHISRCYMKGINNLRIDEEIKKAEGHIIRTTLDCFKYLNVFIHENIKTFEKRTKNVDISVLDNGKFYPEFCRLKKDAVKNVRLAKKKESLDIVESLRLYENAYNTYSILEENIDNKNGEIHWL